MKTNKLFYILLMSIFLQNLSLIKAQNEYKKLDEAKGIAVGSIIDDFEASDINGEKFKLSKVLSKGPLLIVFYRGHWCPVCNRHLSDLQDSLQLVYKQGASLVAVSPEKHEYLKKTAKKTDASFTLVYDEGYKISKLFDVAFRPKGSTLATYNIALGAKLKKAHSDESQRLPIPATFIIDKQQKVVWRHFDPDYKKRASVKDIIEALEKLN